MNRLRAELRRVEQEGDKLKKVVPSACFTRRLSQLLPSGVAVCQFMHETTASYRACTGARPGAAREPGRLLPVDAPTN